MDATNSHRKSESKYDAYEDLGLDRSLSSEQLDAQIAGMMSRVSPEDTAELDKLQTLRSILGSQPRRFVYDTELSDASVEELGVPRLREIARMSADSSAAPAAPASFGPEFTPVASAQPATASAPVAAAQPAAAASAAYAPSPQADAGKAGGVDVQISIPDMRITEPRSRNSSWMWTAGWVWIVLVWLYALLKALSFMSGLDDLENTGRNLSLKGLENSEIVFLLFLELTASLIFAAFNTLATLSVLQMIWNIRHCVGMRKIKRGMAGIRPSVQQ